MNAGVVTLPGEEADRATFGSKAFGLAELMRWGFRVPEAVAVGVNVPLTSEFAESLVRQLGVPLAVRSSATDEDGELRSFAGMHESVLDVGTPAALLDAMVRVRASGAGERARVYRQGSAPEAIPFVVQKLVRAQVAGVVFSADPRTGRRGVCLMEAVPGLGEALVSGHEAGIGALVDREGNILDPPAERELKWLSPALVREVATLATAAEKRAGHPVDVEWAHDGANLWALQCRPLTALPEPGPLEIFTNTNAAELLPEVARPMTMSVLYRYVGSLLAPLMTPIGLDVISTRVIDQVAGRVYFNMNAVIGWLRALPIPLLGRVSPASFAKLLGGDQRALGLALRQVTPRDLPVMKLSGLKLMRGSWQIVREVLRHHTGDNTHQVAQVRAELNRWKGLAVSTMPDASLLTHLDKLSTLVFGSSGDAGATIPAGVGMMAQAGLFLFTRVRLRDRDGSFARRLLSGAGTLDSAASGVALRRVAELMRLELGSTLDGLDYPTARTAMGHSAGGMRVSAALDAFFADHGHHARGEVDVALPRWFEQPEWVWAQLQVLARGNAQLSALRTQADHQALLSDTLHRLDPLSRRLLHALLLRAVNGVTARENIKSEAVRSLQLVRQALLEVGARLTARGALATPDDVFFLTLEELPAALDGRCPEVATRKSLHALNERLSPPAVVVGRWVPSRAPPPPAGRWGQGTVVHGLAASSGVVEGLARIVPQADSGEQLQAGEILVAPFTDPGWTPLFVGASAIVMDFGGVLSHGAIVAREYGLPAVVNVGPATKSLRTGQRLRVDGNSGVVTVLSD